MSETRKVLTLRLDPHLHEQLRVCSEALDESMNKLAATAIDVYVRKLGAVLERDLTDTLDRIRAYRERDPGFEGAIAAVARGEIREHDSAEGTLLEGQSQQGSETRRELEGLLG